MKVDPARGRAILLVLALSAGTLALAPQAEAAWPSTSGGPDAAGWRYLHSSDPNPSKPTYSWEDIASTGTFVSLSHDQISAYIAMPFSFSFYGTSYSQFKISSNGFISFNAPATAHGWPTPATMPNTANPNFVVAGYWDDLAGSEWTGGGAAGDKIHYKFMGSGSSEYLIVQYTNVENNWDGDLQTFQLKVYEGSSPRIEVHWNAMGADSDGDDVLIGIEGSGAAGQALLFRNGQDYAPAGGTAVRFYINAPPVPANDAPAAFNEDTVGGPWPVLANDSDPEGDTLTITGVSGGTKGTPSFTSTTVSYTPTANLNGADAFTYTVSDGQGNLATGTVTVNVNPVNDAPTLSSLPSLFIDEDAGMQSVALSGIDEGGASDEDSQSVFLTVSSSNPTLIPTPALSYTDGMPSGSLSFMPAAEASGTATLTVTATDNGSPELSTSKSFAVVVASVNDPPTLDVLADLALAEDDGLQTVALAGIDEGGGADENAQALAVTASSSNPSVVPDPSVSFTDGASTGSVSFSPAPDAYGTAVVTVTVDDSGPTGAPHQDTFSRQFTVSVGAINDPPVAVDDGLSIAEDAGMPTLAVLANDSDGVDAGETLSVSAVGAVTPPGAGSAAAAGTAGVAFTTAADYYGPASFDYTLSDGNGGTDQATVTLDVTPVNDLPDPQDDTFTLPGSTDGNELDVLPNDLIAPDAGETLLLVAVGTPSAGGSASVTGSVVTYTPDPDFIGTETFTYTVRDRPLGDPDGLEATALATIDVVTPILKAVADPLVLLEDGAVGLAAPGVLANDVNVDGDDISAVLVSPPAVGSFSLLPNGALSYTPPAEWNGVAQFKYRIHSDTDGEDSNTVTSLVTVKPVNDAPTFAAPAALAVLEDSGPQCQPVAASPLAGPADESGQALQYAVSSSNPALFVQQPTITPAGDVCFEPAADGFGASTLTVTLSDDGGSDDGGQPTSAAHLLALDVLSVNDVPSFVAGPDVTVGEDSGLFQATGWATAIGVGPPNEASQARAFIVTASDPTLFSIPPAISAAGKLTFKPGQDAIGVTTVDVRLVDSGGTALGGVDTSPTQSFLVTIENVNDNPTALADTASVPEDSLATFIDVLANDYAYPDFGETLTVESVTAASGGVAYPAPGGVGVYYQPAADVEGTFLFTYKAVDGNGGWATAAVTVNVIPANDAPDAVTDTYLARPGEDLVVPDDAGVMANDSDPEGDPFGAYVVEEPQHGALDLYPGGGFRYTPYEGFLGQDGFKYVAQDSKGAGSIGLAFIQVAENGPPTANFEPQPPIARPGQQVLLRDFSHDADGPIAAWAWKASDGWTSASSDPVRSFLPGGTLVTLTVTDGDGATATYGSFVYVHTAEGLAAVSAGGSVPSAAFIPVPPVADAGPDQRTFTGVPVQLDGTRGDGATAVHHAWRQISGPPVALHDAGVAQPAFTAPAEPATLAFTLVLFDGASLSIPDTIVVTVVDPTSTVRPAADAGPDLQVAESSAVTLSGRVPAALPGQAVSYRWEQLGGPTLGVGSAGRNLTFVAPPAPVQLVFQLTATVGGVAGLPDQVTVTVVPGQPGAGFRAAPGRDAGSLLFLPADGVLAHRWDFGDGANSTETEPEHQYARTGSYTVTLRTADGQVATDIVHVYVPPVRERPHSDASGIPYGLLVVASAAAVALLGVALLARGWRPKP